MPFNTKFTPSQYQDRDQYNEHVLNERYATVKALRESYSHIYQELSNLRNNLQDYKAEQDNQPELATSEADRIRYNNEVENRYLALKSIQLNTSYPDEYGHTVRPFSENRASEQIRLHCHYMISGSHHFKQYHLAKTSCLELNQDNVGESIKDYDTTLDTDLMKAGTTPFTDVTFAAAVTTAQSCRASGASGLTNIVGSTGVFTTSATHGLVVGDKVFFSNVVHGIAVTSTINATNNLALNGTSITMASDASAIIKVNDVLYKEAAKTNKLGKVTAVSSDGLTITITASETANDYSAAAAPVFNAGPETDDSVDTYKNKEFFVLTVPSYTTFTVASTNGGAIVKPTNFNDSTYNATFEFRKYNEDQTVTFTMNSHSFATGDTTTLAGFTSTNGFDLLNGQSGTITKTSATVFTMSLKTFNIKDNSADASYAVATDVGNCDNALTIYFPFKKFYLNKLDATNSAAVYGNGSQTFKYSDNYVTDQTVLEGHIYLLKGTSDDELDGRQSASVLGRNVQNLENMIEIIANNANATEQALNRIVQIAELVGVEIDHA